ncbi:peptidoglycan DD-metalloendopeptidase family protein [soil metagenome]
MHPPGLFRHHPLRRLTALLLVIVASCALVANATGQDLNTQLDQKKQKLEQVKERKGVLSTTIQRYGEKIDTLIGQVATLRNREALVQQQLSAKTDQLASDKKHLVELKDRLHRSLKALSARLVGIYQSDQPDALTVILNSDGFDDLLTRYNYLSRVSDQDTEIAGRVRNLRDDQVNTVERVRQERQLIFDRKAELDRTRVQLESRESELTDARSQQQAALKKVKDSQIELEGDVSKIQDKIAAQVAAAQSASTGEPAAPAGPFRGVSSEGFIWPVNGPVVSPFGPRTINGGYENHPGIDIAVGTGTEIHAAGNGKVIFTQPEASSGGYGNYTCIDHGGGISTCYAHQEQFLVSAGEQVKQGQVIGISDCTGYCFGPHLHFEVRINGAVTDPIPYLP